MGWDDIGVTPAIISKENIRSYQEWLGRENHGDLDYMANQLRCYPDQLLPGAKSAVIFISYYKQEKLPFIPGKGLISSYARGRKYHNVHHRRLKKMIQWFEERVQQEEICKGFSDSTPILEKALAVQAGLGWFGKNTLLIHRKFGTFTLLSGFLTTLEIPDSKLEMRLPKCGKCTRCLDACPTGAFIGPYKMDARRCLSYHLIESKKSIPEEIAKRNPGYLFGCDVCQDVCPHNARKPVSEAPDFSPKSGMGSYLSIDELRRLEKNPEKLYGTPLQRRGVQGLSHTHEQLIKFSGFG